MKKAQGFTLIELIIVIIILGILAVTAAPKFINMQDDARAAQMKGLKGAIAGAMTITYGKAALDGNEKKDTGEANVDGVNIVFGYPEATMIALADVAGFDAAANAATTADFGVFEGTAVAYVYPSGSVTFSDSAIAKDVEDEECYVQYTQATDIGSSNRAQVSAVTTGC